MSKGPVRAGAASLLAMTVAAGGCAEILGLDDPAGRLEGAGAAGGSGSTGTDASGTGPGSGGGGPGPGGGPGAGGAASTATGTGTSTGTGAGGTGAGGGGAGALALPDGFVIQALGRSDEGAVALVRWTGASVGTLCDEEVPVAHLAAVGIDAGSCDVLTTLSGENPVGVAIEQHGPWLGIVSRDAVGPVSLNTPTPIAATAAVDDAGLYALWNVETPNTGYLLSTAPPLIGGHLAPRDDGAALFVQGALRFGFAPALGATDEPCANDPADSIPSVHFVETTVSPSGCARPRGSLAAELLDVGTGTTTWALVSAGNCVAVRVDDDETPTRTFGGCEPLAHLLVQPDGDGDRLFMGSSSAGPCSDRAGLIAHVDGQAEPLWCDDGVSTARVIPFLADATHVHFVRVAFGAELWKVPVGEGDAHPPVPLCTSCSVRDAVASGGMVYLIGNTSGPTDVLGTPIDGPSQFWAWLPVGDL